MGKIIASYLIKAHLHVDDEASAAAVSIDTPTNDQVKNAVIDGLLEAFEDGTINAASVSLIERTDD